MMRDPFVNWTDWQTLKNAVFQKAIYPLLLLIRFLLTICLFLYTGCSVSTTFLNQKAFDPQFPPLCSVTSECL